MTVAVTISEHQIDAGAPLREAMRHLARGVSVITAGIGEERTGLTATTAFSLSLEPATMVVCVNRTASALPVIARNRHLCINLLAAHHEDVANRFAGRGGLRGAARYDGASWIALSTGALALVDAVASVDCELDEIVERHSHAMVIGLVKAVQVRGGAPLVYNDGRFGTFSDLTSTPTGSIR